MEAAGGSGVASSPEPDQEARLVRQQQEFIERETEGRAEFAEELRGSGFGFCVWKRGMLHISTS